MFGLPEKLHSFKCYNSGNDMIGVADVTLPELSYMSESLKGAGIGGEVDSPSVGQFQSMTTTINWHSLTDENISFGAPKAHFFDFWGSVQVYNRNTCEYESKSVKVVMKCFPKKLSLGSFDVVKGMGTSGEFEVIYLKISIDKKVYVEIDKFNFICKIGGVDYLAKIRKDLGMS